MGRFTLVVALAVLIAGCNGVVASESAETVTPAPVPTDGLQYPPGVSDNGVVASRLASAHAESLATTSYTLTAREEVRLPDGKLLQRVDQTRTVGPGGQPSRSSFYLKTDTSRIQNQSSEIEYWSNGTIVVARYQSDERSADGPVVNKWPVEEGAIGDLSERRRLADLLAGTDPKPLRTTPGGVTLVADAIRDPVLLDLPLIVADPSNLSLRMRVRYDGVVVASQVTFQAVHDGQSVLVEQEMRVTNIGGTTVERPPWVSNASTRAWPSLS